jgi:hypothetical protein
MRVTRRARPRESVVRAPCAESKTSPHANGVSDWPVNVRAVYFALAVSLVACRSGATEGAQPVLHSASGTADSSSGARGVAGATPARGYVPGAPSSSSARVLSNTIGHGARLRPFDATAAEDVLMPESPHRSGEQIRDAWVAPDGTEFVAGYMYTGKPGPDTGVVYRRAVGAHAFEIAWAVPEHELGTFGGVSSTDLYVGGTGILLHLKESTWTELAMPDGVRHISAVAVHDGTLWIASSAIEGIFHRELGSVEWKREDAPTWRYDRLAFAGDHVFAGGTARIAHRFPDGHWAVEVTNKGAAYESFYVASPAAVYVAGGLTFGGHVPTILMTSGDGNWVPIDSPDQSDAYAIWGRSPSEIYLATRDNTLVWRGGNDFKRIPLVGGTHLSGNADELFVAYDRETN